MRTSKATCPARTPRPWYASAVVPVAAKPLVRAARKGADIKAAIHDAVRALGFEGFDYLRFSRDFGNLGREFRAWGTSPLLWLDRYRRRNYAIVDPRHRMAMILSTPFCWSRDAFPDTPELREFFTCAGAFGIGCGVTLAIPQPNRAEFHFLTAYSARSKLVPPGAASIATRFADLWAVAVYGHRLLCDQGIIPGDSTDIQAALSSREHQCLTLAARGETSALIACRLGISERTVNAHLESATRKCGAKNRQEAIARGVTNGIITY